MGNTLLNKYIGEDVDEFPNIKQNDEIIIKQNDELTILFNKISSTINDEYANYTLSDSNTVYQYYINKLNIFNTIIEQLYEQFPNDMEQIKIFENIYRNEITDVIDLCYTMALEKIDSIISIRIDTYILPLFKNFKVCGIKIDKNLPNVEIIDGIISKIKQILISHDICEIAINYKCQNLKEDILNMVDICENIIQTEYNKYYSTIAEVTNYINNTFIEAEDKENSILYNICKDTIKSHIYSQLLNQTLLNNYIKKNIIQKIHDIYCTNIIEYNIDMIIKDNMSYIIKFNQNDLNKSSCCFLNSNYCNDNPEYKLYPFTQYEAEIYTLVNYNINNMSQYINTLIIDCIYLVLQNDYNIENNIILLLSEYESGPKISNMIIQFSNESSIKIVLNALKYYFKNINLKIYPYDVNKIRICCLHHNMEQFINILSKIIKLNNNFFNEFKLNNEYYISENEIMGKLLVGRIIERYVKDIYYLV